MRILKLGFILSLLATLPVYGQAKYRVGLCPGSVEGYHTLAKQVANLPVPDQGQNEALLQKYLTDWRAREKLSRFQVAIHYPDKKVRFWQASASEKGLFFEQSVSAAAGRGGLSTDIKPGDNQRCFFQDTTVVLDTLRIRLGDFTPETRFTLTVGQKTYALPLNAGRTELLLYAGLFPGIKTGHNVPVQVAIDNETYPVTFYFLSPAERAQLVRSLRDWTVDQSPSCSELPELLVAYLTRNWGGKQCVSPALYLSAQRRVVKSLLQNEQIVCTP